MNEIALSDDLIEITAEINIYKHQAGQAVFEIGKRLKHVKENDLVHGQWLDWLQSLDIPARTAQAMIQVYEQFGNTQTSSHLGTGKLFEMLSLPESVDRQDFITTPQTIPSTGETKTVDEMTVRELREVKQALKAADERARNAEAEAKHWQGVAKAAQKIPPQVITKAPDDYETIKREHQKLNSEVVKLSQQLNQQREHYQEQMSQEDNRKSVNRELKKYCEQMLRNFSMDSESIIYNYNLNHGDRDAFQILEAFQIQFSHDVQVFQAKLKNLTAVRAAN